MSKRIASQLASFTLAVAFAAFAQGPPSKALTGKGATAAGSAPPPAAAAATSPSTSTSVGAPAGNASSANAGVR